MPDRGVVIGDFISQAELAEMLADRISQYGPIREYPVDDEPRFTDVRINTYVDLYRISGELMSRIQRKLNCE